MATTNNSTPDSTVGAVLSVSRLSRVMQFPSLVREYIKLKSVCRALEHRLMKVESMLARTLTQEAPAGHEIQAPVEQNTNGWRELHALEVRLDQAICAVDSETQNRIQEIELRINQTIRVSNSESERRFRELETGLSEVKAQKSPLERLVSLEEIGAQWRASIPRLLHKLDDLKKIEALEARIRELEKASLKEK